MAYYCQSCTTYRWGLEGWLSGQEYWLRFQRTQVWVPAHMVAHNPLSPQSQGIRCFLLTYAGTTCKGCIHADKTPVNISKLLCVAAALVTMGTIAPHSTVCFPGVVTSCHFIEEDTRQESCDLAWGGWNECRDWSAKVWVGMMAQPMTVSAARPDNLSSKPRMFQ